MSDQVTMKTNDFNSEREKWTQEVPEFCSQVAKVESSYM